VKAGIRRFASVSRVSGVSARSKWGIRDEIRTINAQGVVSGEK
jgi:hypothetical protein